MSSKETADFLVSEIIFLIRLYEWEFSLFILLADTDNDDDDEDELRCDQCLKDNQKNSNDGDASVVDCKPSTSSGTNLGFTSIVHQNYHILCEIYKDPQNQCEKVSLHIQLPNDAKCETWFKRWRDYSNHKIRMG